MRACCFSLFFCLFPQGQMTELTEHEKLEKRRARRQQRILASASSRLNKITGTQSGKMTLGKKQRAFLTFLPKVFENP
jgi:hypothetical protein